MNNNQKIVVCLVILIMLILKTPIQAQNTGPAIISMSIEECYQWSKEHYPIIKNIGIIDETTEYNLKNASIGNLPRVSINGQATYQSAVTELPISIPNVEISTLSKDQYKVYGEVYQPLTNFFNVNVQKKIIENNKEIEKQKVEVDLHKLKDRINQLYFGLLLIKEKIEQLKIIQIDLDSALVRIETAIQNGTASFIDKRLLNVEHISLEQQIDENKANQLAFSKMLSMLSGKNITETTTLVKPTVSSESNAINSPELRLFNLQNQSIHLRQKQISTSLIPNIGLFGQGGYGRPALNFLSNEFEFYYIGGIKLNWNLSSIYNYDNEMKSLDLGIDKIAIQKETFLLNTRLTQLQQSAEVRKYENLIKTDKEIIKIREDVFAAAKVQLNNGLITTIDYLRFLNEVNKSRQMLLLHETQYLLAQYNLKTTTGN